MILKEVNPRRRVLIDTHIWVWFSNGDSDRISPLLQRQIEKAAVNRRLFASVVSVWEIALKARQGKLLVAGDLEAWVGRERERPGVRLFPLTSPVVILATEMAWPLKGKAEHKDPADRFLVATARKLGAVLVTCDEVILKYAESAPVLAFDARP